MFETSNKVQGLTVCLLQKNGGIKGLQMCMFGSEFYLQQVRILRFRCKSQKCATSNFYNFKFDIKRLLLKVKFSKLKKFQNFVDVTAIWLFSMITTIAFFHRFIRTPDTQYIIGGGFVAIAK